jgi:hypothetical protein
LRNQDFVSGAKTRQHFDLAGCPAAQLHGAALQFVALAHIELGLHARAVGEQ